MVTMDEIEDVFDIMAEQALAQTRKTLRALDASGDEVEAALEWQEAEIAETRQAVLDEVRRFADEPTAPSSKLQ
jgi:hypothetical protein